MAEPIIKPSLYEAQPNYKPKNLPPISSTEKLYSSIFTLGLLALLIGTFTGKGSPQIFFWVSFILMTVGSIGYILKSQLKKAPGVKNDYIMFSSMASRGLLGWMTAIGLTGFYVIYYWFGGMPWGPLATQINLLENLYRMFDPLSQLLRGENAQPWFVYGTLYTFAIVIMGFRAILKYRHNRYQIIRTSVIMFSQFILAWLIPALLVLFQQPEKYLNYGWPLSYKDLRPQEFLGLWQTDAPKLAAALAVYGLVFTFILTPVLTYFYGKRWYCSWVCGCGGLANTLGDSWRQNSSKSRLSWSIEKKSIYSVLVLVFVSTGGLWYSWATGTANDFTNGLAKTYGFMIGMVFSGAVGTGFYPILGTRIWCRFGCPQAAILGILQTVFSRFRITTNGSQCISCGNCSTYCEMGIDVRSYAQKGENIVRASCVGCGMCASSCPRGVLSLENGPKEGRLNPSISITDSMKTNVVTEQPSVKEIWGMTHD